MIKLENVGLVPRKTYLCENGSYCPENMQGLKDFYELAHDKIIDPNKRIAIWKELIKAEKEIAKANGKGNQPVFYSVSRHSPIQSRDIYDDRLLSNDKNTYAKVLIHNPTAIDTRTYRHYTMEEVKYLLSHTNTKGENLFEKVRSVGPARVQQILPLIELYDEQVLRQYQEYYKKNHRQKGFYPKEIFTYQQSAKKEKVNDELKYIVEYLLDTTKEEFVWGQATDNQKNLLLTASRTTNDTRENLIELIANYTTLTEEYEPKVLKRFIKK